MNKPYSALLLALIALLLPATDALSNLKDYALTVGTGTEVDMSSAEVILKSGSINSVSSVKDIGFKFEFDGTIYSTFSASSNGVLGLGKDGVTSAPDEIFEKSSTYPLIAPFWDYLSLINNGATYLLSGKPGNQVMTVQWEARHAKAASKGESYKFQIRLYEGINRIEFWYGTMTQKTTTSAKIGAAVDSKNFASLYFGKKGETLIDYSSTQSIDIITNGIASGTLYTFDPLYCNITLTGNTAEGGTSGMKSGDILFAGKSVQRGASQVFRPFQVSTTSKCATLNFTFTISGAHASDYVISPSSTAIAPGAAITPTITFTPSCIGTRQATLTVTSDNGFSATYPLSATGASRISWTGNTASGGVSPLSDGSILLNGEQVKYATTRTFTPFSIRNTSTTIGLKAASVVYTLDDPTGQYSLSVGSASLGAGAVSTPVLTFKPNRFGVQSAKLTIDADCETRTFTLNAVAIGAGAEFTANGQIIDETSDLFVKTFECSGESVNFIEMKVRSLGNDPLVISGATFFRTDSVYGQGVPKYPVLRDLKGNPLPSADYFVTDFAGMAPANANEPMAFPIVLNPGESRTFYLNFVAQRPGKRSARGFIATNALNFIGKSAAGVTTDGLLAVDLFGKGLGAVPSATLDGAPLKPIGFGSIKLRTSRDTTIMLYNSGACDLRIARNAFRVINGDTREFRIVGELNGASIDQNDNYVIAPGDSASVVIRFAPSRSGSRRATVLLRTNDSAAHVPGITERGGYYWDLFGLGSIGLEATGPIFEPGVIDDLFSVGANATVENTTSETVTIIKMEITGTDAAEFTMDPANPWPTMPFAFMPGEALRFSVLYTPAPASQPGGREASLRLITSSNDTIFVPLNALAGSRTLAANPTSLFDGVTVPIGKATRQTVMLTNTGTMPLRLSTTKVTGVNANQYTLSTLPRLVLAPGQTEYFEVTYRPTISGASTAQLEIASNATNGMQTVQLGGMGRKIKAGQTTTQGTSGVTGEPIAIGMSAVAAPNPAREAMDLTYTVGQSGEVSLKLYDAQGREVRTLESGHRDAGEYTLHVNVGDLPTGIYHYRLEQSGQSVNGFVGVVK